MRSEYACMICCLVAVLMGVCTVVSVAGPTDAPEAEGGTVASARSGSIHIIPALSAPSVKNGGTLTIQAVITSEHPVAHVSAHIEREDAPTAATPVATLVLHPAPANLGGVNAASTTGLWQTEWTAQGLTETTYTVTITVRDTVGHTQSVRSLRFSDPIAGRHHVGSPDYPNGGMRRLDALHFPGEPTLACAVIDVASGYAYFGTDTMPGQVVKVALGDGSELPTRVGAVMLESEEAFLRSAVIDTTAGYAYFGTDTSPGRVVKVALGSGSNPPVRVGAATLQSGESHLRSAVADPASGFAYFGTATSPGRVVKVKLGRRTNPPVRVGAAILEEGENSLASAVIDTTAGFAYFGTATSPGRVVKVALGGGSNPPVRVAAAILEEGENSLASAVIDTTAGFTYFGTDTSPGRVVKVALGGGSNPPVRVGAATLESNDGGCLVSAVADAASGFAYFGTSRYPNVVVKVALGSGSNPPVRVGATLQSGESHLRSAVADPASGFAYFGTTGSPAGFVLKVALGSGSTPPVRLGSAQMEPPIASNLRAAVIDAGSGHGFFGGGSLLKVALGHGSKPPALVHRLGLGRILSAVIDLPSEHVLLGIDCGGIFIGNRACVGKVATGEGSGPLVLRDHIQLVPAPPDYQGTFLQAAVIDTSSGHAYFAGTDGWSGPGRVHKIAVGHGSAPLTHVGDLWLEGGEDYFRSAVIDPASGHAFLGTDTRPGRVVKVALGSGSDLPTRVGALTLDAVESSLGSAVIDSGSGYAYFGAPGSPARVVKVALGAASEPPIRVGAAVLPGVSWLSSAVIDTTAGYAYFGSRAGVVKVALGSGSSPPSWVATLNLENLRTNLVSAVLDPSSGHAYFGTEDDPASILRVGLSQQGFIKATRLTMPEAGRVSELRFFSHAAAGNVRFALYNDDATPTLAWQSGVIPNTADSTWLTADVAAGTPSSVDLPAGTYWLAWQVDTAIPVPSHATGSPGDGLYVPWTWGAFPQALDPAADARPTLTDEVWTAYLVYDPIRHLTVTPFGSGSGKVASTPAGIDCTTTCAATFTDGTAVTLTAIAVPGSAFGGWSGACTGQGTCTVLVNGDVEVGARFDSPVRPVRRRLPRAGT